ncbi:MAG TPA: penicillin-insensitive murein endopeptidase [Solirubrobacteraceae bacterium]
MRRLLAALAGLLATGCGIGVGWAAQERPAPNAPDAIAIEEAVPAPQTAPAVVPGEPPPTPAVGPPVRPRSRALGLPFSHGRLVNGVPFPPVGIDHFTWDPALDRSPSRVWRRYGTDQTVHRILVTLAAFRESHPEAPPVGVGDLSRPHGGEFGRRYGGLGHASHQNGLDVDVYYPRRDKLLTAPTKPSQVDRRLAQALVDAFLRAGATDLFVGPSLNLHGPKSIVQPLVHHDDHVHVRFRG